MTSTAQSTAPAPASEGRTGRSPWEWVVVIGVVALCLAPLAVILFELIGKTWYASGDRSLVELRVRDVGAHTPLVGPYSRYGWSHPGPAQYWLLSIPYRLTGSTSISLLIATLTVNVASVGAMLWVAWRRGRLVLLTAAAVVLAILIGSLGSTFLIDPWNPFITVLPVGLFVMLVWADVDGERWALPAAVGVGSFVLQSHVGYIAIVGVGALWLVVPRLVVWWRRDARGFKLPAVPTAVGWTAIGIGAVLWAPVVWDQLFGTHNLTNLFDYFTNSDDPAMGFGYGAGLAAREVGRSAPWFFDSREPVRIDGGVETTPMWNLWLVLAALAVGAALSWRAAHRATAGSAIAATRADEVEAEVEAGFDPDGAEYEAADRRRAGGAWRFAAVLVSMLLAGVVAVARVTEVTFDYLVRWWWIMGALALLGIVWAWWSALSPKAHRAGQVCVLPVLLVVLGAVSLGSVRDAADLHLLEPEFAGPIEQLTPATVAALPPGQPVRVATAGSGPGSVGDGMRLQLERAGIPTLVSPDNGYKFGEHRSTASTEPTATVWVVSGEELWSWLDRTDMDFVTLTDPLTPDERLAWRADAAVLADQLRAAGRDELVDALYADESLYYAKEVPGVDLDLLERVDEARRRGRPYAVFIGEPTNR